MLQLSTIVHVSAPEVVGSVRIVLEAPDWTDLIVEYLRSEGYHVSTATTFAMPDMDDAEQGAALYLLGCFATFYHSQTRH